MKRGWKVRSNSEISRNSSADMPVVLCPTKRINGISLVVSTSYQYCFIGRISLEISIATNPQFPLCFSTVFSKEKLSPENKIIQVHIGHIPFNPVTKFYYWSRTLFMSIDWKLICHLICFRVRFFFLETEPKRIT